MVICPNKSSKEWKDLVIQVGEAKAYYLWNRNIPTLAIQRSNLKALEQGKKTISIRPKGEHGYQPGDLLNIIVKGKETTFKVQVQSITTVEDFTKLPENRKDDFAKAIGDYTDYQDLISSDDYAREDSPLSIQFPEFYKFLKGKIPQDIIKYNKIEEDKKEYSNDLTELVNKVKLFLEKKLAILENKNIPNKKFKENQIKRILDNIKALDGVETINTFIEESYQQVAKAEKDFDNLIKNKEKYTRKELIERLSSFNDFANGYSILDEISKSDIEEYFNKPEKGIKEQGTFTIQDKLQYAVSKRDLIKQRYLKQGIPLLADYLFDFKSEDLNESVKTQIEGLQKRIKTISIGSASKEKKYKMIGELEQQIENLSGITVEKKTLIKQLQLAAQDESALDYMFSPLISSEDSVLALFAKAVKTQLENARLKDIEMAEEAEKAFDKFLKTNGKNRDNVASFNSDIYEVIEVPVGRDEEGNTIYVEKKAFVQNYDVTKFEKAKNDFFKKLGPKPIDDAKALKAWQKSVSTWFKENTKPKSKEEIDSIIAAKNKELADGIITQKEYTEWQDNNISEYRGQKTYKGELSRPADKYHNPKWLKLYNNDGTPKNDAGKYHKFLTDTYFAAQEKLPENFRRGYLLPSVPKGKLERLQTNGLYNTITTSIKEGSLRQEYDTEYGTAKSLANIEGTEYKFLPVFFTQNMDVSDVSTDLISSILKFNSMANRYEALNEINGEIALTKSVMEARGTIETNSKGQKVLDAFAKKMGYNEFIRKNGESYSKKHIDSFIDMVVYGEMQKTEEIFGLEAGKLTNTLLGYSALTTLAVDILKGTSNNIQGNIQNIIEASSGEFYNRKNLRVGKAHYIKSISSFLSDFGKIAPKTLPSKLVELYDPLQGKFKDEYGREVSGTLVNKLFRTNTLFFNQNLAEHEIQVSSFFAMLDSIIVEDKETKTNITLLEAYNKYGVKDIYDKTNFTEAKRKEIQNRIHALNKRLHGVYNDFDKGTAQRYSLGRLAIMYRKYLIPGYKRRWKKVSGDQELGAITEGYYRTFWNTFVKDLRNLNFNLQKNWSSYTPFEKAQIKRTTAEAVFILSLTTLVIILKAIGDDDEALKKNYVYNFLLYQAVRMRSETASYINPIDAYRVVKSPSAMTTTLDRVIKFTNQLAFTWDPEKRVYQRKTGVWEKGDNKSWAYFLKLMGFSGYNLEPSEAVKVFESVLNK